MIRQFKRQKEITILKWIISSGVMDKYRHVAI